MRVFRTSLILRTVGQKVGQTYPYKNGNRILKCEEYNRIFMKGLPFWNQLTTQPARPSSGRIAHLFSLLINSIIF
jgi:hypothetical protein